MSIAPRGAWLSAYFAPAVGRQTRRLKRDKPPGGGSGSSSTLVEPARMGETAMFTAQLAGPRRAAMGMNVPGNDDRQFALNVLRWLARGL